MIDRGHVALGPAAGKADAAALSQSDHFDRGYIAEHGAGRVDDRPRPKRDAGTEKGLATAGLGDEADVLAVRLLRRSQAQCNGPVANLCLGEVPDRKHGSSQLALRQHVHHVALILRRIRAAVNEGPIADDLDARVMARGDGVESQQVGALAEPVELQVPVAFDARIRCQPFAVGTHVRIHDVAIEVVTEVEDEMVDVQLLRHSSGIVDIGDRTATGIALASPQPHGDADDVVAGVDQLGGGNRRVDAPAERDENPHAARPLRSRSTDSTMAVVGPGDVVGRRRSTEGQSKRAASTLVGHTHRGEHVRGLHRATCARRRSAGAHSRLVEQVEQRLVLDPVDAHVRRARDLERAINGLVHVVELDAQAVHERIAQRGNSIVLRGAFGVGGAQRGGHRDDAGDVVRATATLALLAATHQHRRERRAAARHQHADTLRTAELVRRQRHQVDMRCDGAQVEPARGLHRVGVDDRVGCELVDHRGDLGKISDGADLVVDCHHADERDIGEGGCESLEIHTAGLVDTDHAAIAALDRVKNRMVLDSWAQRGAAETIEGAEDGCVVGLGATAGEDHLARTAAENLGDVVAGLVDGLAHLPREAVGPRGIGELLGEERQHRLDGIGPHRRGRRMIEVDVAVVHGNQARPAHWPSTAVVVEDGVMDGYTDSTYGDAFADVYDEWYQGISDVATTIDLLAELAGEFAPLPVLELGVGTGRLAIPLAARGVQVVGLDASPAMLAKLEENDRAKAVSAVLGDMVDDQPGGPFALAFVAYNTFFNLLTEARQRACFAAVAERLVPGGAFVIEAFVPEPHPGSSVDVRSMTADSVVLAVTTHDDAAQTAQGQYISFSESGGVRMRPWAIRYATVAQLDAMATDSGFRLDERWEDAERTQFTADSPRHVSVYRTNHTRVRTEGSATS